jgi:hypothetical protein
VHLPDIEMPAPIAVSSRIRPELDPEFIPASLWNRAYRSRVQEAGGGAPLAISLERGDGSVSVFRTAILAHEGAAIAINNRYVERLLKFLLWQKGAQRVVVSGESRVAAHLKEVYSPAGARAFDYRFMGERVHGTPLTIESARFETAPAERETAAPLGRHLDGCRIGFDLGASDRKCAAIVNGEVVFSDETPWNPGAQADPQYHFDGINDSLKRGALAAGGRHRRQFGGRHRKQRGACGVALPLGAARPLRCPGAAHLLRPAGGVGRRSVPGGERRRGDGAGGVDGAQGQRGAGHRDGEQPGGRVRQPGRNAHAVAERTGIRASGLPRGRAGG